MTNDYTLFIAFVLVGIVYASKTITRYGGTAW